MTTKARTARSYSVMCRDAAGTVSTRCVFAIDQYAARAAFEAENPGLTVVIVRRG